MPLGSLSARALTTTMEEAPDVQRRRLRPRVRSLGFQIVVIPLGILLAWLAATLAFMIADARSRIAAEVNSSSVLARAMVESAVAGMHDGIDPLQALGRLNKLLPHARHVRIVVASSWQAAIAANLLPVDAAKTTAPYWFVALITPHPGFQAITLAMAGQPFGQVFIAPNPDDEIDEIWTDFIYLSGICLLAIFANATAAAFVFARALRPIRDLAAGLERLENGDYGARLPPSRVSEFEPIAARFDGLAASLARSERENRELYQCVVSLREVERKSIAHELHDEVGPCLFGLRAEAACIARISGLGSSTDEIRARVAAINALVDALQQINRRILNALRPVALAERGLAAALRDLVDAWQERNPTTHVSIEVDEADVAGLDERLSLAAYRIVQEGLTNVARHASAEMAEALVSREPRKEPNAAGFGASRASEALHIQIRDNGRGMPPDVRRGLGLRGMEERAREFGGSVDVTSAHGGGVVIDAWLPLTDAAG